MKQPHAPPGREQRLLRNARREGLVILAAWAIALVWCVGGSYLGGYRRDPDVAGLALGASYVAYRSHLEEMSLILGMPAWVFWSIVLPWALCLLFSVWFCFRFMADDDLGRDRDEGPDHA
jgi:hypothetical protein